MQTNTALTLGSQFIFTYTALDSNFNPTSYSTFRTLTVNRLGATMFGKSNVSALTAIRTSGTGVAADTTLILLSQESNGDVSLLDTSGYIGWATLPIASQKTTTIPAMDTDASGTGTISYGTVSYVGTSSISINGTQVATVVLQETTTEQDYYFSILELETTTHSTIDYAPTLGFVVKRIDQASYVGSIGEQYKRGTQEVIDSDNIK
jgi:hypothetical protein